MSGESFSFDDEAAEGAASQILGQMPEPQEHAIQQHETQAAIEAANVELDDEGTPFDPAIHTGTKLKNGTWRKRKAAGGNSPRSRVARPRGESVELSPEQQQASALETQARAAGAAAAATLFMMGQMLGGPEWKPEPEEIELQTKAWGDYFVAKGHTDFPPGLALTVAIVGYAGPRFMMPETQSRVSKAKGWITLRLTKWKINREYKKRGIKQRARIENGKLIIPSEENGTRSNTRND